MKTDFKFSNLLGTVYRRGNLVYTSDGTSLLSPVGNRVTVFDLINNKSHTLPFAHRTNITRIALHPGGRLLLSVDEQGHAILSLFQRRVVLYHFSLKEPVSALVFSPCGRFFAVALGRKIEVWKTPSTPGTSADDGGDGGLEFAPFVRHRTYVGHHDTVQSIEWSGDSRFFLSASKDLTARIWSLDPEEGFMPTTLAGHRTGVLAAWFSADQETIFTISADGALFQWQYLPPPDTDPESIKEEDEHWRINERHYFYQSQEHAHLTSAAYHPSTNLLVTGFSHGLFMLHELPSFSEIHKLSISASHIDTISISPDGSWLAFGSAELGQLLVWEWQSESYILKQTGHFDNLNALTYSPSGDRIITASDDGKIKVWDTASGFCSVTFTEHTSGVTAVEFARRGNVLFTASLDGSVRAFDLIRYRCFRTFTAPKRLSFSSLAVDPSGEVVAAGSLDDFDVHIWSVQTGQLLDTLAGHEGPISSLSFTPNGGTLVSGSWDRTVRIWSVFARTQTSEPLQLQADVLCVAVRPDGEHLAISTLDGQLTFWRLEDGVQESGLDARRDVSGGRKITDRRAAVNVAGSKSFTTIAYSADGSVVLAGGESKFICLYAVETATMVAKFTVSVNVSLQGTQEFLNSKLLTEAGPTGLLPDEDAEELQDRTKAALPGSKRGVDAAQRTTDPSVRVTGVAFSPTGRAFCAASTEGLLVYSLDSASEMAFDPFDLDIDVTPETTLATLKTGQYLKSLAMSFRLNSPKLITHIYRSVPVRDIGLVVRDLPSVYLDRLLRLVAKELDVSPNMEYNLLWLESVLKIHGTVLKERQADFAEVMRAVQRSVGRVRGEVMKVAEGNESLIGFLLAQPRPEEGRDVKMLMLEDGDGDGRDDGEGEWVGLD